MKNSILFFVAVVLMTMPACKKETDETPVVTPVTSTPKLKTIYHQRPIFTYTDTLTYDATGRIIKRTSSDHYTQITTYTASTAVTTYNMPSGMLYQTDTYFLNSNQLADSLASINPGSGNAYTQYLYDHNGYLIIAKFYNSTRTLTKTINYVWQNGNKTDEYESYPTGDFTHRQYGYDTDYANTIGNHNEGFDVLGRDSHDLLNSVAVLTTPFTAYHYQYTFDQANRATERRNIPASSETTFYTYY